MIDWHCHILPGMDDGSKDVNESLTLVRMLSEQGVHKVVATPHFFANDESVTDFIRRREKSYGELKSALCESSPDIVLGAEVRYYPGIGKLSELSSLCIEGSKLLLLEMPMEKWTEYTVKELTDIANARNVRLILAHIERYLSMQGTGSLNKLYESGIIMQVNASFFIDFITKRKALAYLQNGNIHLIGSDAHGVRHRPPRLGEAYEIIRKKFGNELVTNLNEYGESLLN